MNYQTEVARLSSQAMDEITRRLIPLERELDRLEHRLSLLPERERLAELYDVISDLGQEARLNTFFAFFRTFFAPVELM